MIAGLPTVAPARLQWNRLGVWRLADLHCGLPSLTWMVAGPDGAGDLWRAHWRLAAHRPDAIVTLNKPGRKPGAS